MTTRRGRRTSGAVRAALAACVALGACAAAAGRAQATPLPARLAPATPFPHVLACDLTTETIAPGVERASYRIVTTAGPLRIAIVIADPGNPSVRFDTALAHDALGGRLETVSAMALRTGAVAGINGDYYAVGAGGAPLGLVVRHGALVHGGAGRPAFAIGRDGAVRIASFDAHGGADGLAAGIGGGPVLLRDGMQLDDSGSTNVADRAMRIPVSVLVRFPSGRVGFVAVDGRAPARSIGINRAELVPLLRALGAADAMLLDSGGSSTLVARVLGEDRPSLRNVPSDGVERPVADGLFVYSDAPVGPPAALIVRPARVTALPGVRVNLTARTVDAAGHALGEARQSVIEAGARPGMTVIHVEGDGLRADVPVRVVRTVARLAIGPSRVVASPHQLLPLTVSAWDAGGTRVLVGEHVTWAARDARVDRSGRLAVGDRDAFVTARVGRAKTSARILVGWHDVPLPVAAANDGAPWQFATTPPGGLGATEPVTDGVRIRYDFSTGGRAAYARATRARAAGALLAVACDVTGDGNGEALRLAFVDGFGARESVTLAPAIDFTGVRRLSVGGLVGLAPPLALRDVYVVGTMANPAIRAAGRVDVAHCTATVAGA